MNEERPPRRVGESLDAVARRLGAPTASSMGAVFTRWDDAVGPTIAAHTRPIALSDGVLTVGVDEPGWGTQLRYMTNDLVARIAEVVGAGVVGRIELRIEGATEVRKRPTRGPR
jgi:predicted nucleic acid-binding Zn ribbon protein